MTTISDLRHEDGMLGSKIEFTPEVYGSGTQVYFISVSGYTTATRAQ